MARVFNGSSKINYGHLAGLDGAAKVAISFWLYPIASTGYDRLWAQMGANGTGPGDVSGISMTHDAAEHRACFLNAVNNDNSPYEHHASTSTFTANAWQQVLVQYDGAEATPADRLRLYVGNVERTASGNPGTIPATLGTTDQPFMLGVDSGGSGGYLTSGRIAGLIIWIGVVLDNTARTALAAGTLTGIEAAARIHYDGLWQGSTPTNLITSAAATVTGTTETTDPPGMEGPPTTGQPFTKRLGGILHAGGASPLGHRRW